MPRPAAVTGRMKRLAGGRFRLGSDIHYPEEAPARWAEVGPFRIDRHPVTNAEFAAFVAATGYLTVAERPLDPGDYPEADPDVLVPGSAVFTPPQRSPVAPDPANWWRYVPGACWRHPHGPGSGIEGLETHPVVHIAHDDAQAYAHWARKRLPTEAEWEFAARGGLDAKTYAWGDELAPGGKMMANYWQGPFPMHNLALDGYERTSPVGAFPPNGYGLYDMIGNVWEWTADDYRLPLQESLKCCVPQPPPGHPPSPHPYKVLKGGSHLCAENYCQRYRPAARYPQTTDTSTSHIGFRCAADA